MFSCYYTHLEFETFGKAVCLDNIYNHFLWDYIVSLLGLGDYNKLSFITYRMPMTVDILMQIFCPDMKELR